MNPLATAPTGLAPGTRPTHAGRMTHDEIQKAAQERIDEINQTIVQLAAERAKLAAMLCLPPPAPPCPAYPLPLGDVHFRWEHGPGWTAAPVVTTA